LGRRVDRRSFASCDAGGARRGAGSASRRTGRCGRAVPIRRQRATRPLTEGGLLTMEREGRHRYYRLVGPEVASALEGLALLAVRPRRPRAPSPATEALRRARTCYDHLAGELGVTLAQALEERGLVMAGEGKRLEVTAAGGRWFSAQFEMDTSRLVPGRHGIARRCLDWSERRHHIAGPLGAALLNRFRELGWVTQAAGSARAVELSRRGAIALARTLDISL